MLPTINEIQADFVLTYAKNGGLNSLVKKISLNESKDHVQADLQPELVNAFTKEFPNVNLTELDSIVEWILITAIAKRSGIQENDK